MIHYSEQSRLEHIYGRTTPKPLRVWAVEYRGKRLSLHRTWEGALDAGAAFYMLDSTPVGDGHLIEVTEVDVVR